MEYECAAGHRLDGSPGVATFQIVEGAWLKEHCRTLGGVHMAFCRFLRLTWWTGLPLVVGMCLAAAAQQAAQKSDASLAEEGALALAAAHGEKPRYGGKFLSVGNEEIPTYDIHQT